MQLRRVLILVVLGVLAVGWGAVGSASAVTIGQNFAGTTPCDGMTVQTAVGSGASYTIPANGTITSWTTSAESAGNRMSVAVWRRTGATYVLVGASTPVVPTGVGLKTYATSITVQAGDLLGSWVEARDGTHNIEKTCSHPNTGETSTWWTATYPFVTTSGSLHNDTGWLYNISATFEAEQLAPARAAYCSAAGNTHGSTGAALVPGTFLDLEYGQPATDSHYTGATPARYVQGKGLTCDNAPAGYTASGTAGAAQSTVGGIYAYWRLAN